MSADLVNSTRPVRRKREIEPPEPPEDDIDYAIEPEVIYVDSHVNSESFAEHCLPHHDTLRAFAHRLALGRRWEADDIVQDALVKALRLWPKFELPDVEDPSPWVRAWLCEIVMHRFVEGYRKRRRRNGFLAMRADEVVENMHGNAEVSPAQRKSGKVRAATRLADDRGIGDEVETALRGLDGDSRDLIERVDFEGESYAGAARRLGIPIGTVMSRLFRARRVLEQALRGYARREYSIGK